ncbi:MAG: LysM peptidoglycan-binding domain-containing protein [Shimia sp.]
MNPSLIPGPGKATLYRVRPGDELFRILVAHYGARTFFDDRQRVLEAVQANNRQITDIDRIFPGQTIVLPDIARDAPALPILAPPQLTTANSTAKTLSGLDETTFDVVSKALSLSNVPGLAFDAAGGIYGVFEDALRSAVRSVQELEVHHWLFRADTRSNPSLQRHAWDKHRLRVIDAMGAQLGPFTRAAMQSAPWDAGPGSLRQVIRFDTNGQGPSKIMRDQIDRMRRGIGRVKIQGGILSVASLGLTLNEVHHAENDRERVGILLDALGSTVGGVAGGIAGGALAAVAVGTPVGWAVVAGVVVGTIVVGTAAGAATRYLGDKALYDDTGTLRLLQRPTIDPFGRCMLP